MTDQQRIERSCGCMLVWAVLIIGGAILARLTGCV